MSLTLSIQGNRLSSLLRSADLAFTNTLVVTSFAYTAAFNYMDDGLRTAIAGLFGILIIIRTVLSWQSVAARIATFLFLGFAYVLLVHLVFIQERPDTSLQLSLVVRLLTCLGTFLAFAFAVREASAPVLIVASAAMLVLAIVVALTGQGAVLGDIPRPATFTGGEEGVHATGYALTTILLGSFTLWRAGWLTYFGLAALAGPAFVLVALFQVRTTWFMCVVYLLVAAIPYLPSRNTRGLWPGVACLVVCGAMLFSLIERDVDLTELSSGRTAAYTERVAMVLNRPLDEMLLGTGPGSEVQSSSVWWWSVKNSHNDYLDIAIQSGVVGLLILVVLLGLASSGLDRLQLPLFVAYFASSTISNGLIGRPFLGMMFLAFMCVPYKKVACEAVSRSRRKLWSS